MKTHTVPIITNGPFCGDACPWLALRRRDNPSCLLFSERLDFKSAYEGDIGLRCGACRHVTERAEALP